MEWFNPLADHEDEILGNPTEKKESSKRALDSIETIPTFLIA